VISLTGEQGASAYSLHHQRGTTAMTHRPWSHKTLTLIAAFGAVACVVALLSIGLSAHEPVASAALGPEWQCSRVAYVLTTCTRTEHVESAAARLHKEQVSARPGA